MARKPYVKPTVEKVSLVQNELAATGCKTKDGLGRNPPTCLKSICKGNGS
jgi:hypothetical protein